MLENIVDIVKPFAPAIASALTGNIPGAAVSAVVALKKVLCGDEEASDQDLETAVETATTDDWLKVMELNQQYEIELKKLDVEQSKNEISAEIQDRDSARNMQNQNHSTVPATITYLLTGLVALVVVLLIFVDIDRDAEKVLEIFATMIMQAWLAAVYFWFGSSYGSKQKDTVIGGLKK